MKCEYIVLTFFLVIIFMLVLINVVTYREDKFNNSNRLNKGNKYNLAASSCKKMVKLENVLIQNQFHAIEKYIQDYVLDLQV